MTFSPVVPFTGLQGWQFLSRTIDRQVQAFNADPTVKRDIDYFSERIGSVKTAEELVSDRRLLRVSLTAFGLEDDLDSRFLIQKVLEEGSIADDALANRFSDKRYLELTKAFGFGDFDTPRTVLSDFAESVSSLYLERAFEVQVGASDEDMRLALSLQREIDRISTTSTSETASWYLVLGSPPLKSVFEKALGLGVGFSNLSIDRQAEDIRDRAYNAFEVSDFADFAEAENLDALRDRFLLGSELDLLSSNSSESIALSLLRSGVSLTV